MVSFPTKVLVKYNIILKRCPTQLHVDLPFSPSPLQPRKYPVSIHNHSPISPILRSVHIYQLITSIKPYIFSSIHTHTLHHQTKCDYKTIN